MQLAQATQNGTLISGLARAERIEAVNELHRRYGSLVLTGLKARLKSRVNASIWRMIVTSSHVVTRIFEILVAVTMLILLSPLFALVAAVIKLGDGGPIFFWQKRVGQWGQELAFPKFRSMVANAEQLKANLEASNEHKTGLTFKMRRDPRVTAVGRIIRKLSIDELPQLWCVLTGQLALVGPRPPLPSEVARYTPSDRRRLDAKPGLTCIWQVSGRSDIPFDQQVELDVRYIHSQNLRLDLMLLLRTIPAVLTGRGSC